MLETQVKNNYIITTLVGVLGLLIAITYNTAFQKGFFTCQKYILNTYLYILMALVLISLEVLTFDHYKINLDKYMGGGWLSFIIILVVLIGLLLLTMMVNPRNVLLKHLCWLLLVMAFGFISFPAYKISKGNNTLPAVLLSLVGILVVFTSVAFIKPDFISLSWGPILFFLLLGVIITYLVFLLTLKKRKPDENMKFVKGISYFIIVLFIFFILYDTKQIMMAAKKCKTMTADYINQSLGVVLDALNIFMSLVNVYS